MKYVHIHIFILFRNVHPRLIVFPSGASVSVRSFCDSCIWVLNVKRSQIIKLLERVQICKKCCKRFVGPEGFFWRTAGSLTVQEGQTMDSWTTITNQTNKQNTAVDPSGNNTVLRIKCMRKLLNGAIFINSTIIFSCGLNITVFYVKHITKVGIK